MIRKVLVAAAVALALACLGLGAQTWRARAPRPAPAQGELRGAWHVHTSRSDGRASLDEVVDAARAVLA